jgi:hypothetical protein
MPGKAKVAPPIDRPLSRAYVRSFTGWSTAFPPGQSNPASCRLMENMLVDRNGALCVRPGLQFLSYILPPDYDTTDDAGGYAYPFELVGNQEPFFVEGGGKALLFGVRENDGTVGFRALLFSGVSTIVHNLTDPEIGFRIPQGEAVLNFSADTTHIEYLQIDNKIFALSDNAENMRLFMVGTEKLAKKLGSISVPEWDDGHKLTVMHPEESWILGKQPTAFRTNKVLNPSFEDSLAYWIHATEGTSWKWQKEPTISPVSGDRVLEIWSTPTRTNLCPSPLDRTTITGLNGWKPHATWGNPTLTETQGWMKITDRSGKGLYLAYAAKAPAKAGTKYKVAVTHSHASDTVPRVVLTFYGANGQKVADSTDLVMPGNNRRFVSDSITAPTGTTSVRVSLGGTNQKSNATYIKVKDVVLCEAGESTDPFSGSSGTDYHWTGTPNASPSEYHPPRDIWIYCAHVPIPGSQPLCGSVYVAGVNSAKTAMITTRRYNRDSTFLDGVDGTVTAPHGSFARMHASFASGRSDAVLSRFRVRINGVGRGERFYIDAAMLEPGVTVPGAYFDGATPPTETEAYQWDDPRKPHESASSMYQLGAPLTAPTPETPTSNTLIATGGATANQYKMAFFYTFENEVGESAASKIVEVRTKRPWSDWLWEIPNSVGEPSGTVSSIAEKCADQLVAMLPPAVYDRALAEGALRWNLYAMSWTDQDPVPVTALHLTSKELYSDQQAMLMAARSGTSVAYKDGGWISVTPARKVGQDEMLLPTKTNRRNYSDPSRGRTGLVAGDRMIIVADPSDLASIRWSSNRMGEYTNFSAIKGGGVKTLVSGNLFVPASVVLWQNPQSVDTITVLCMGVDGLSSSYYMHPASVSAQSGSLAVMGFEETTNTPGTVSPYAAEVLNNALYRPIDQSLLKSTASNYNINHKSLTDAIENMWKALDSKNWIMSAQLDNRLFYLVHNPNGELLEDGCKGNEIWVYDVQAGEAGVWSRLLVQGRALRTIEYGNHQYMSVTKPDGLYYFDHDARMDDYVDPDTYEVKQRSIPWMFETNTQGANKAHDAWCHLQQLQVTFGNWQGEAEYGLRGLTLSGTAIDINKRFTDDSPILGERMLWDTDDYLLIRRDMKEWHFYARSTDEPSSGQISLIQYRYTPVSVNVGYEYGSIETFEYGANVLYGPNVAYVNGIPNPPIEAPRP